jgi:4-cresol dehydrogenase (hydroxylating)
MKRIHRIFKSLPIQTDAETIRAYSRSTAAKPIPSLGVAFPKTVSHIQDIVRRANRHGVKLYPISRGQNWGYGDANPVSKECLIVDLRHMNRIIDFDPTLGLITVEPGVTPSMLKEFLDEGRHAYFAPSTGAGPNGSLVGNALERGFGLTPHPDHFGALLSLEAVLPNGDLYKSNSVAGYKWGVGPYIDGLFSQGNFGIVTRATFGLVPKPEHTEAFLFSIKKRRYSLNI